MKRDFSVVMVALIFILQLCSICDPGVYAGEVTFFRDTNGYFAVTSPEGWKVDSSGSEKGMSKVKFEAPKAEYVGISVIASPSRQTTDALHTDAQGRARQLKEKFPQGSFDVKRDSLGDQVIIVFSNVIPGTVVQELVHFQSYGIVYTIDLRAQTKAGLDAHRDTFKKFLSGFVPLYPGRQYSDQEIRAAIAARTKPSADATPTVALPAQPDRPKKATSTLAPAVSSPAKNKALIAAAAKGDLDGVKRLLAEGADVNTREHRFTCTPLMLAFQEGHAEVVKALLEAGADVHAKTDAGHTAFDLANRGRESIGQIEICRVLAEREPDTKERKGYLNMALVVATAFPEVGLEIVKELLGKGACPNDMTDGNLNTPLMKAASTGQTAVVKELVQKGANVDATHVSGYTALMFAAENGHLDVVRVLLEMGANVRAASEDSRRFWYFVDNPGKTFLSGRESETALDKARRNNHSQIVELLEAYQAKKRTAPKPVAALPKNRHPGSVPQAAPKDPKERELVAACTTGQLDKAKTLLANGVSVTCRDPEFEATPLHWASFKGHKAVVALLLEKGADINALNKDGRTPFMMAAGFGQQDVVELLLKKGAETAFKDKNGKTALDYASGRGHKAVAKLLQGGKRR